MPNRTAASWWHAPTPEDLQANATPDQILAHPDMVYRETGTTVPSLESVCEFLERTEPAHPAPLLIRRAARLLDLSFLDIIRDIAPGAADQIENLGGLKRE